MRGRIEFGKREREEKGKYEETCNDSISISDQDTKGDPRHTLFKEQQPSKATCRPPLPTTSMNKKTLQRWPRASRWR